MKSIQSIYFLLILFIFSCSSSDDGNNNNDILNNYTSECIDGNANITAITGPIAAYWDNSKGIPIPLTQVPILGNIDGQFIHNQFPGLGFPLPQGYSGFEAANPPGQVNTLGVNVVRNDNAVLWRYIPTSQSVNIFTINDAVANEVNLMFNFFQFNGNNFDVICSETVQENLGGGITRVFSSRLIRFGNFTGQVYVIATLADGLPGSTFLSSASAAGPNNEYNSLVADIFLPLNFQLLVNNGGELDSDLDGVPDVDDAAPNNPNIQ